MKKNIDTDGFLEDMGKHLSEAPRTLRSGKHRAAFTALREVIESALAQGYTMKATWSVLRAKKHLSMSYETFRAHCRRAGVGEPQQGAAPQSPLRAEPLRPTSGPTSAPGPAAEPPQRGFRHERVPRKSDIYG